jgi:hypothetical protein
MRDEKQPVAEMQPAVCLKILNFYFVGAAGIHIL